MHSSSGLTPICCGSPPQLTSLPHRHWELGLCQGILPPAALSMCGRTHLSGDKVLRGVGPAQVHGQHHTLTLLAASFLTHLEQVKVASFGGLQPKSRAPSAPQAVQPSPLPTVNPVSTPPRSPGHPGTASQCGQHSSALVGGQ